MSKPEDELEKLQEAARRARERILTDPKAKAPERVKAPWEGKAPAALARPALARVRAVGDTRTPTQRAHERAWAGVPERYRGLTLASPELLKRLRKADAAKKVSAGLSRPGIVFTGASGDGKTTLACAALGSWLLAHGGTFLFAPAFQLAHARVGWTLGDGEPPLVDQAIKASLLVLDDLGVEEAPFRSAIGDVIDQRYNDMRVTWVTTGFELDEISKRYGAGRARRIFGEPNLVIRCG